MERELTITYAYHDTDIVEVLVSAWNGSFAGAAKLYVGHVDLATLAGVLEGFPTAVDDSREVTLGAFGQGFAGGAASLSLQCSDRAGHSRAEIKIEGSVWNDEIPETVSLQAAFEPAGLDRFVTELITLSKTLQGKATLRFTIA